jgi:hypothetical protein
VAAGNGVLKLAGVTEAAITGNGRIVFPTDSDAVALATGSSIATGASGYVSFPNGIELSSSAITLDGAVLIGAAKTITIGATSSKITLKSGSTVYVGAAATAGSEILTADNDVELTGDAAVLTVAAGQKLDVSAAGLTVKGDATFGGDLTLTAAPATFNGVATFAPGAAVTMTTAASIVKLKAGAGIAVGEGRFPYNGILQNSHASADATLTPAVKTKLTFAAVGRTVTQDASATNAHGIKIGGELGLLSGASYVVESIADKVGTLTVDESAVLTLGFGLLAGNDPSNETTADTRSSIVLTGAAEANGAALDGIGKVVAGGTAIVGGTAETASWRVVGAGTVTIEADAITASAATAKLTATTGAVKPSITVAEGKTLTIGANTTIALTGTDAVGSIVLTGAASGADGGTLAFAETTSFVTTGQTGAGSNETAIENATITGLTVVDSGESDYYLVSITAAADSGGTIKASTEGQDVALSGATAAGGGT